MTEVKEEIENDNNLKQDNPECQKLRTFIDWFGQPPAIKIRYYSDDYRGIHAAVDIKAGSQVLLVP